MDAFVASGTPDAMARAGGANVLGRRYQDIVQDMVDMYAWGQVDSGFSAGGWRYSWNSDADNSASQWAAIGMIAAERHFGCTVPQWVKDRNDSWLNNSFNSAGYFGYRNTTASRSGYATGPSGMVQLSFAGKNITDSRWQACEQYLANNWDQFAGWDSSTQSYTRNDCRYYAYYPFAKAMRLALPQEVTHLPGDLDWYGDETRGLARALVDTQNNNGSWPYDDWPYVGERTAAAWNVIVLTRTLFERPPVAIIHAEPNPGAVGQTIHFDASASYHVDPAKEIDQYLWDFDASDGVDFEHPDATGIQAGHAYGALEDYTVSLKVIDNSTPERFDISTLTIHITVPPHPPTAVIGGPYIAAAGDPVQVDGSGSYDIDESEGDSITAWDWESDFAAPYDFAEAHGETAVLPAFTESGRYDIALRVTDNTELIFPDSGEPNLTHVAYGEVMIYNVGVTDLSARPKGTKCQFTWSHIGADSYDVLRSEKGLSDGFELIGSTNPGCSTFLDYNVELSKDYWYRIRCELNNETVLSAPVHVNSQGRIRNRPPVVTSNPVTEAQEGALYQYDVDATDPESTALTYLLDQTPDGMGIDAATGLIIWTPSFDQVGVNDVTVRVQDARGASATQFFQIIVSPRLNQAPTAHSGGPYSALTAEVIAFDGSGSSDPDGDPIVEYHWVFGDGSDAYGVQVSHAYTAAGTYTITLYVTDNRGATGSAETSCRIDLPNHTPIANAGGPYESAIGIAVAFDGSQSYDADGDQLTYTWNFGDSTPPETGITASHVYTAQGTYQATLTVNDGRGGLDTAQATVTITASNQPPEASFTVEGDIVKWSIMTFDASGSTDPEGQPLTSWEWDFGDGGSTTGAIVTYMYEEPGDYTVVLTVTDDKGAQGTAQQVLSIAHPEPNHDPIIDAGGSEPYRGAIGTPITFTATGGDPEGDTLTYTWTCNDETYSGQSVDITFDTPGTYEVQLLADDGYGGTAQDIATVIVYDPDAPGDQVLPEVSFTAPSSGDTLTGVVDIEGSVTDDNLVQWVLEYAATGTDEWHEISSGTDPVTDGLLGRLDVGVMSDDFYRLRLTAYDYEHSSSTWIEYAVNDPVKLGRFSITYDDLTLPAMGIPIQIRRTYDSTRRTEGDFGIGWSLDIKTMEIREDANHNVFITLPNGRRVTFDFTPEQLGWWPFFLAKFTAPAGVSDELEIADADRILVRTSGGGWAWMFEGYFDPDTYILKTKEGFTYTIDQELGVRRVEDRNGNYLEINENGIFTSCGRDVVFNRDGEGRIASIMDPEGHELTYTYDANGDLVQYEDQDNNAIKYSYINDHYLLDIEDPDGNKPIRNEYYPDGRLSAHEDSDGNRITYTYDIADKTEIISDFKGNITVFRYDDKGNLIEEIDPFGASTVYTYDDNGNKTSITYPSGRTVRYTYDDKGNKLTETHEPEPGRLLTTVFTYNSFGQVTSVTRPLGDRVEYIYDYRGAPITREVFDSTGTLIATESRTYDYRGNILTWTDLEGNTYTYTYDAFGNPIRHTDPTGVTTIGEYDSNGNLIVRIDGLGNRTESEYNGLNKLTQMRHGGQVKYRISYNYLGKILTATDARGAMTTFDYDPLGNIVAVTDPQGNVTRYEYDAMSKLAHITNALGNSTVRQYDEMNRLIVRTGPDGGPWGFDYMPDGEISSFTTPNAIINEEHDGMNRVVRRIEPERTIDYEYDDNNNMVSATEHKDGSVFVTTYTYDALGRVLTSTDPNGRTITYEHNARGNRTTMTTPDGLVTTYAYDEAGRIQEITTGSDWVAFTYDGAGRRDRIDYSNGTVAEYTHDSVGGLTGLTIRDSSGAIVASYEYTLDGNGMQTGVTMEDGTASYTLDSLNRLTREDVDSASLGTFTEDYTYDVVGNRLDPGATHGPDNRLLTDAAGAYGYDGNGNVISRSAETFGYDSNNRLIFYSDGTTTASYEYDYDHRRVIRTVNGDVTDYIYDGQNIVAEYLNGIQVARYTHGLGMDKPLMVIRNGQTYFYHTDGLGSVVAITDEAGQVVQRYVYDAWGNIVYTDGSFSFSGSGLVNTLTYTGREYDAESGLYHYRARAYDPAVGRFLQKDALPGKLMWPQTQNLYSYALNNPLYFTDPTGQVVAIGYALLLRRLPEKVFMVFLLGAALLRRP